MVAADDLRQADGSYALTTRLLARQARQDESRSPATRPWDGDWEIAVVATAERRPAAERTALRQAMAALRLAELREGSWLRPANLDRTRPTVVTEQCTWLTGTPDSDPSALAARLWDLTGWARRARALTSALNRADTPADRFTVAAAALRHLLSDPLLPAELLPGDWPGAQLRTPLRRVRNRTAKSAAAVPDRLGGGGPWGLPAHSLIHCLRSLCASALRDGR